MHAHVSIDASNSKVVAVPYVCVNLFIKLTQHGRLGSKSASITRIGQRRVDTSGHQRSARIWLLAITFESPIIFASSKISKIILYQNKTPKTEIWKPKVLVWEDSWSHYLGSVRRRTCTEKYVQPGACIPNRSLRTLSAWACTNISINSAGPVTRDGPAEKLVSKSQTSSLEPGYAFETAYLTHNP